MNTSQIPELTQKRRDEIYAEGKNRRIKDATKSLVLIPAQVFAVIARYNEESKSIHGYFRNPVKAMKFAGDCGWAHTRGEVIEPDGVFTDGVDYYRVEKLKLQDVEESKESEKQIRIDEIKSRLTAEEIELLGLSQPQL